MKKIIDLHQVDAFTDKIFGGNPAGVVTNADGLNETEMANIAREMNLSETAFLFQPTTLEADVKLRYFTPAKEVKFCGHATIGALFQLAKLHMYGLGGSENKPISIETNVGILPCFVSYEDSGQSQITFTAPKSSIKPYRLQGEAFANVFGIDASVISQQGKIWIDEELKYAYIPINSIKELGDLKFDFRQIHEQFSAENIVIFCLYTNETVKEGSHLHARGLAPLVGVDEDPFTGSIQAGLIYAAKRNHFLAEDQKDIIVEQGNFIGRPGFAKIHHDLETDEVFVTASAVPVFSTKLEL